MKSTIRKYYKKHLENDLLVKRITFRKVGGERIKMILSGGIDGKARCSIRVDDILMLHPEFNDADNVLRLHSCNQYFLRYNMTQRIMEELNLHNDDIKDIGILLDKFDMSTGKFTEYVIVAFYEGDIHRTRTFTGNPEDMDIDLVIFVMDHTLEEATNGK